MWENERERESGMNEETEKEGLEVTVKVRKGQHKKIFGMNVGAYRRERDRQRERERERERERGKPKKR